MSGSKRSAVAACVTARRRAPARSGSSSTVEAMPFAAANAPAFFASTCGVQSTTTKATFWSAYSCASLPTFGA